MAWRPVPQPTSRTAPPGGRNARQAEQAGTATGLNPFSTSRRLGRGLTLEYFRESGESCNLGSNDDSKAHPEHVPLQAHVAIGMVDVDECQVARHHRQKREYA
jgi:hypothetical protein